MKKETEKYKVGTETKEKILNATKKLFYKKGYKKTTYNDICKEAEVNTGTFHYHFQSKRKIAGLIYNDFMLKIKEVTGDLLSKENKNDLRISTTLEIMTYMQLFFSNKNVQIFFRDLYNENIPLEYSLDLMEDFFLLHVKKYKLNISKSLVKTIAATNLGIEQSIIINYCNGYLTQSPQELIDYDIRMTYNQMNISSEEINVIIEKAKELSETITLKHVNYFDVEAIFR